MIVKILDDNLQDKHLIEAARFRWGEGGTVLYCYATLDAHDAINRIRVHHGDRIFFMNEHGQTIDSKHIILNEEKDGNE